MKIYKDYMDSRIVSPALHHKILIRAWSGKAKGTPVMALRYAFIVACFSFLILSVGMMPGIIDTYLIPAAIQTPLALTPQTPGAIAAQTPPALSTPALPGFTLDFNKAMYEDSAKINIRGHFWQEVSEKELEYLFPVLSQSRKLTATAHFSEGSLLYVIEAKVMSDTGVEAVIKLSQDRVETDYTVDSEAKTTDISGVPVTAGYYEALDSTLYFASFTLGQTGFYAEVQGGEEAQAELACVLEELIKGGKIDLSAIVPVSVPLIKMEELTLAQALSDPDYGSYLPESLPDGFVLEAAKRRINQERNDLLAVWTKGMGYVEWRVSILDEEGGKRITDIEDTRNYDLAFYPVPRAESVPDSLRKMVENPVFRSEDLSLEAVKARAYTLSDLGDEPGSRMRFGVLFGQTLVELNVKGVEPEKIYDMLKSLSP